MKTMGTPLITASNELFQEHPWIFLFAVEINAGLTWRYAAYPEAIEWNGYTWDGMSAAVEMITQDATGRLSELNVVAENVSRTISAYQENYDLRGKDVTVYIVNHGHLDETDVLTFAYQVNNIQRKSTEAVIELGHPDLFSLQLPHRRHTRDHCPYSFRDEFCRYPEDLFDANTEQDFTLGGDGNKGGGWITLNIANATIADINQTNAGKLTVQGASGGPFAMNGTIRTAAQVYKAFKGNFDFYTRLATAPTSAATFGFYVQAAESLSDYVAWIVRDINGTDYLLTHVSQGGQVTEVNQTPMKRNLRFARTGSGIVWSAKADSDADWTTYKSQVLVNIGHKIRVGFCFPTPTTAAGIPMQVDHFKAYSGGDLTCDYGFDSPNGCKAKNNTPHFGGAAGLPYGPLAFS